MACGVEVFLVAPKLRLLTWFTSYAFWGCKLIKSRKANPESLNFTHIHSIACATNWKQFHFELQLAQLLRKSRGYAIRSIIILPAHTSTWPLLVITVLAIFTQARRARSCVCVGMVTCENAIFEWTWNVFELFVAGWRCDVNILINHHRVGKHCWWLWFVGWTLIGGSSS